MRASISIRSVVSTEDDTDRVEVVTDGEYSYGSGVIHLAYYESPITGMAGTRTTFDVYGDYATMSRVGRITSYVQFKRGESHHFAYRTPDGMMNMSIETRSLVNRLGVGGGTLEILYDVGMQGSPLSRNNVIIRVDPVQ